MIHIDFNAKNAINALKQANDRYRPQMFLVLQSFMERIRSHAPNEIIPSAYPNIFNPDILRQKQPSTPGKLTSRTQKLVWALRQDVNEEGGGFTGRLRSKKQTAMFEEVVTRDSADIAKVEQYNGTLKYSWTPHATLTRRGLGMPSEDESTFFFRVMWDDTTINGSVKRPFLTPAAEKLETKDFVDIANKRLTFIIKGLE